MKLMQMVFLLCILMIGPRMISGSQLNLEPTLRWVSNVAMATNVLTATTGGFLNAISPDRRNSIHCARMNSWDSIPVEHNSDPEKDCHPPGVSAELHERTTSSAKSYINSNERRLNGTTSAVDIRNYGARSVASASPPATVGITADMSSGSLTASLSSASIFKNGDGVTIYGAGTACTLSTPGAPNVTPSNAAAGTGTGLVVDSPTGSSTYAYVIVARNKNGCLTAAGSLGSTTLGLASLGPQSVGINSITQKNKVVTVATSKTHTLSVGTMVNLVATAYEQQFGGWYLVTSVPDLMHFTFSTDYDTRIGAVPSAGSGGNVYWYGANHLSWKPVNGAYEYYIYGRAHGSLAPIGVSRPQGKIITDSTFDDFGAVMMDGGSFPSFLPSLPQMVSYANPLTTTILSGAGTTTLTLADSASTSVKNSTILLDSAPAILAAANATRGLNGTVYIPPVGSPLNCFPINSYLTLPQVSINQAGQLCISETVQVVSNTQWYGLLTPQASNTPSFGVQGAPTIQLLTNSPGIWSDGSSNLVFDGLSIYGRFSANGNLLMALDGGQFFTFNRLNFISGSTADYMGMDLLVRGADYPGSPFPANFEKILFGGGPTQVQGTSATPIFYCSFCGEFDFNHISLSKRGLFWRGSGMYLREVHQQGGITPVLFACQATGAGPAGPLNLSHIIIDTMPNAALAQVCGNSSQVTIDDTNGASFDGGGGTGFPSFVTGYGINDLKLFNTPPVGPRTGHISTAIGFMYDGVFGGSQPMFSSYEHMAIGPNYSLFSMSTEVPPAPICAVANGGPPFTTAGTWRYAYGFVYPNHGVGTISTSSSGCAADGKTKRITIKLPALSIAPGAIGYFIFANGFSISCIAPTNMTTATTLQDTGPHCGISQTSLPGGGPAGIRNGMLWGSSIVLNSETLSASPRMTQNALLTGPLTSIWTALTWTPDKSITITRIQAQAKMPPSRCLTNAVIRTTNGESTIDLPIAAAANDSGSIAQNYPGGKPISIEVQKAASRCSVSPADVNIIIQYKMQ